jgi:hypothetical protein
MGHACYNQAARANSPWSFAAHPIRSTQHFMPPFTLQPSIVPQVIWREVPTADVLSALSAVDERNGIGRSVHLPGESVQTYLDWAHECLDLADTPGANVRRLSVESVLHAKRAVDRLFDGYLERDRLNTRLPNKAAFSRKVVLLRRRLGRRMPWMLIEDLVADPRNMLEHEYSCPSHDQARMAVEVASTIAAAFATVSPPTWGPAFLGSMSGGSSSGPDYNHVYFTGFGSQVVVILWPGG